MALFEGTDGNNILTGTNEADIFRPRFGNDRILGGLGIDTLDFTTWGTTNLFVDMTLGRAHSHNANVPDYLNGLTRFSGIENVTTGNGTNTVIGNGSSNVLIGGTGNDTFLAGGGHDLLIGGLGNNILNGGTGTDTASYATATSGVEIILADDSNPLVFPGTAASEDGLIFDSLTSIENTIGSDHADYIIGNNGANQLSGGNGNDTLNGRGGDDLLDGGRGINRIMGGNGIDTVTYAESNAGIVLSLGEENMLNSGAAVAKNGSRFDTLIDIERAIGSSHDDILAGNSMDNRLHGGVGNDILHGLGGADMLDGGFADETASGGTGNDRLSGGFGDDTLYGDDGNDTFYGESGTDTLYGGTGNDRFHNTDMVDNIHGGEGFDRAYFNAPTLVFNPETIETGEMTGMEYLKLNVAEGSMFSVTSDDVFALSDTGRLYLTGTGYTVNIDDDSFLCTSETRMMDGETFDIYESLFHEDTYLMVPQDLTVNFTLPV